MLDNLKNIWKKPLSKDSIIDHVLGLEEHGWIRNNQYIMLHMNDFLERLPRQVLHDVFIEKSTIFTLSNSNYANVNMQMHQKVIIVNPDIFSRLMKTVDGYAKAVLAHELGHIFLAHSRTEDPMEALVDADEFVCQIGYLDELEEFLHTQEESVEKMVRLSFITSFYFSQEENKII
jgi:hypothetical protein